MKKIVVALAMCPLVAFASDIAPGTFELSGGSSLGFNSGATTSKVDVAGATETTTDRTTYGISTTGLYFVIPNLSVGLSLDYLSDTSKRDGLEDGLTTLGIGPAIAYEFGVAPEVALFGLGAIQYVSGTSKTTGFSDVTTSGFGFRLEAGAKYFVAKQVSFDAALGYQYASLSDNGTPKTNFSHSGFGLNVGLSVYLGGK